MLSITIDSSLFTVQNILLFIWLITSAMILYYLGRFIRLLLDVVPKSLDYSINDQEEEQKMLNGHLYNPLVPLLCDRRTRARKLTNRLNNTLNIAKRSKIIPTIFSSIGSNPYIESPFRIDYGTNTIIGDNFYCNYNCVFLDCGQVTIGNNVMLGPNVQIYTVNHPFDVKTRNSFLEYTKPITIGDNCWLGGGVVVLPGVTIGKNSVVGAGSVVVEDVPEDCLVAGNPAVVKKRDLNSLGNQ
ncbi:hypothetical protein P9112_004728 [Eukaryota sp. TZLM1-RC]